MYNLGVRMPDLEEEADFYIVNVSGSVVLKGKINPATANIDIENLSAGKYSLHIVNGIQKYARTFMKIENR